MNAFARAYLQWILLFILMIVWGSSFLLMKRTLEHFSPIELGTLRMVFASGAMLPFALKGFINIKWSQWKYLILFALFGNLIPAYLFAIAQTHISSSLAGILNSLTPIFTLIVGLIAFKTKVKWINIVGLILGLIGAASIIYNNSGSNIQMHFGYAGLIVIATMFYATNINIIKYKLADLSPIKISIYGFSLMFIPLTLFLFIGTPFTQSIQNQTALHALIYPAILGIVCSAIAIVLFNKLIKMTSAIFASSVTYLIPIVAMFIGFLDGENISFLSLIMVAVIIFGVILVNRR